MEAPKCSLIRSPGAMDTGSGTMDFLSDAPQNLVPLQREKTKKPGEETRGNGSVQPVGMIPGALGEVALVK